MDESRLTPNQTWLLLAIRREGPISSMQLKADMRVANKFDAGLDESRLFRDLTELESLKLIAGTLGGWCMIPQVTKEKPKEIKQRSLCFDE